MEEKQDKSLGVMGVEEMVMELRKALSLATSCMEKLAVLQEIALIQKFY